MAVLIATGLMAVVTATDLMAVVIATGLMAVVIATGLMAVDIATGLIAVVIATGLIAVVIETGLIAVVIATGLMGVVIATDLMAVVIATGLMAVVIATGLMAVVSATDLMAVVTATGLMAVVSATGLMAVVIATGLMAVVKMWEEAKIEALRNDALRQKHLAAIELSDSEKRRLRSRELWNILITACNQHPWMAIRTVPCTATYTRTQRTLVEVTKLLAMLMVAMFLAYNKGADCCEGYKEWLGCAPSPGGPMKPHTAERSFTDVHVRGRAWVQLIEFPFACIAEILRYSQ
eukprot:gene6332-7587_t